MEVVGALQGWLWPDQGTEPCAAPVGQRGPKCSEGFLLGCADGLSSAPHGVSPHPLSPCPANCWSKEGYSLCIGRGWRQISNGTVRDKMRRRSSLLEQKHGLCSLHPHHLQLLLLLSLPFAQPLSCAPSPGAVLTQGWQCASQQGSAVPRAAGICCPWALAWAEWFSPFPLWRNWDQFGLGSVCTC